MAGLAKRLEPGQKDGDLRRTGRHPSPAVAALALGGSGVGIWGEGGGVGVGALFRLRKYTFCFEIHPCMGSNESNSMCKSAHVPADSLDWPKTRAPPF